MAKIKLNTAAPDAIPGVRGRFYITDSPKGAVARKWPAKRGAPKTPYDFYKQTEFGIVSRMAANPFDLEFGTAYELTKHTNYVPRDMLTLAAMGIAYEVFEPDGTQWRSLRDVTVNPQLSLDLITETVGSMLWRADVGWIGLNPSPMNGYVLGWQNGPQWQPQGGGGAGTGEWEIVYNSPIIGTPSAVDIPFLAAFTDLQLIARNVTTSANTVRQLWFSTDGGATYWTASGNYKQFFGAGGESGSSAATTNGTATTLARGLIATIVGSGLSGIPKWTSGPSGLNTLFDASLDPITDIRVGVSTGTMSGGEVILLGRK